MIQDIVRRAVRHGDFTLSSGAKSNLFVDASQVTLHSDCLFQIAHALTDRVTSQAGVTAVGGPTLGADPLVGAVIYLLGELDYSVKGFLVRKEAKNGETIEGPALTPADKVVIIEDVVTTGKQTLRAIKEVEKTGAQVVLVLALVDRQAGATETLAGYKFESLLKLSDLCD